MKLKDSEDYAAAEQLLANGLAAARRDGNMPYVVKFLVATAGIAANQAEYFYAVQLLDEAQRVCGQFGLTGLMAWVHHIQGFNQAILGHLDAAEKINERGLMYANQAGETKTQALIYMIQGFISKWCGAFEDAYSYTENSREMFLALDDHYNATQCLVLACEAVFELGREDEASRILESVCGMELGVQSNVVRYWARSVRVSQLLLLGETAVATTMVAQIQAMVYAPGDAEMSIIGGLTLAKHKLAVGELEAALEELTRVKRAAQHYRSRLMLAEVRLEHARALIRMGRLDHASCVLLDTELTFEMHGARSFLARTYCAWTHYYIATRRSDAENALLTKAQDIARAMEPHPGRSLTVALAAAQAALRA